MNIEELSRLTADDIVRAISLGVTDNDLRSVERAVKQRERVKGASFRVGQRVKINHTCRPTYLIGAAGTIRKVNQKRVVMDFDPGQDLGRFGSGRGVTVPFDMLESV